MIKSSQPTFVNSNVPILLNTPYVNPSLIYESEYAKNFLSNKINTNPLAKEPRGSNYSMTDPSYLSLWKKSFSHSEYDLKDPSTPVNTANVSTYQYQTNFKNHADPFFDLNVQTTQKDSYKAAPVQATDSRIPTLRKFQKTCLSSESEYRNYDPVHATDYKHFVDAVPAKPYDWVKYTKSPIYKEPRIHSNETETASRFTSTKTMPRLESIYPISAGVIVRDQEPWPQTSYEYHYKTFPIVERERLRRKSGINLGDLRISNEQYRKSVTKSDFHPIGINERLISSTPKTSVFGDCNIGPVNYVTSISSDDYPAQYSARKPLGDLPPYSHHFSNLPNENSGRMSWPETTHNHFYRRWQNGETCPRKCYPSWELATESDIERERERADAENIQEKVASPQFIRTETIIPVNKKESHIQMFHANLNQVCDYQTTNKLHFTAPGIETKQRKESPKLYPYFSENISGTNKSI